MVHAASHPLGDAGHGSWRRNACRDRSRLMRHSSAARLEICTSLRRRTRLREARRHRKDCCHGNAAARWQGQGAVIEDRTRETLHGHILASIEEGSQVFTDEFGPYWGLDEKYAHEVINHAEEYVRGQVHTNGIENFWVLLKRGLAEPMSALSRFTCSAMWMSRLFASTIAPQRSRRLLILTVSVCCVRRSSASG